MARLESSRLLAAHDAREVGRHGPLAGEGDERLVAAVRVGSESSGRLALPGELQIPAVLLREAPTFESGPGGMDVEMLGDFRPSFHGVHEVRGDDGSAKVSF